MPVTESPSLSFWASDSPQDGLSISIKRLLRQAASWFNQLFSEAFLLDPILAGYVELPGEEALVPFVDADDIADVVVESLLDDKHVGQTYELTGPRQLTFKQVTEEISNATGRDIVFNSITIEEYEKMLKEYQVPEGVIWLISYLFTEVLLV